MTDSQLPDSTTTLANEFFGVGGGMYDTVANHLDVAAPLILGGPALIPLTIMLIAEIVFRIKRRLGGNSGPTTVEERMARGNVTQDELLEEARRRGLLTTPSV